MNPTVRGRVTALALAASFAPVLAQAHGVAGARFFPATLAVDDPAVADELSLPTVSHMDGETDVSGEYSKRLTSTLGVSFGETWSRQTEPGSPAASDAMRVRQDRREARREGESGHAAADSRIHR